MNISIESLPTFNKWVEETKLKDDNMISAYIADLKDIVCDLMVLASENQPWHGEQPSFEYNTICRAGRVLGLIVRDMKAIRNEVNTARGSA